MCSFLDRTVQSIASRSLADPRLKPCSTCGNQLRWAFNRLQVVVKHDLKRICSISMAFFVSDGPRNNPISESLASKLFIAAFHREKALVWFRSEFRPAMRRNSDRDQTGSDMIQISPSHHRNDPPDKSDSIQTRFRHGSAFVQMRFHVWFGTIKTKVRHTYEV
jgi:hypothetical protein